MYVVLYAWIYRIHLGILVGRFAHQKLQLQTGQEAIKRGPGIFRQLWAGHNTQMKFCDHILEETVVGALSLCRGKISQTDKFRKSLQLLLPSWSNSSLHRRHMERAHFLAPLNLPNTTCYLQTDVLQVLWMTLECSLMAAAKPWNDGG